MVSSRTSNKRYFFVFLAILCLVVGALSAGALGTFQGLDGPGDANLAKGEPADEPAP
jgi:hypothetical protein